MLTMCLHLYKSHIENTLCYLTVLYVDKLQRSSPDKSLSSIDNRNADHGVHGRVRHEICVSTQNNYGLPEIKRKNIFGKKK